MTQALCNKGAQHIAEPLGLLNSVLLSGNVYAANLTGQEIKNLHPFLENTK